uniref:Papilin a, proteoglycan-like sulfated glycoprotein n=1 Tax=Hippocampus comes TaxID=109280 RepID=A0A3Q2YBP0_HIPCM
RTCGGGVMVKSRRCITHRNDGGHNCVGPDKSYLACNTEECPAGTKDYREEQCSQFDGTDFKGSRYVWVPYYGAENPCELNCVPKGDNFVYRHSATVKDGTPCHPGRPDICVDGVCRRMGCDNVLDSRVEEDPCLQCGGHGQSCSLVKNTFNTQRLAHGYNQMFTIPAGATSISIREKRPSRNYLAVRNLQGDYYLNGHWLLESTRATHIAGTKLFYQRGVEGDNIPETIIGRGPTTEPLVVELISQEPNQGVEYEYYLPVGHPTEGYSWSFGSWSACTKECGSGHQSRAVYCSIDNEVVPDYLCVYYARPENNRTCNVQACPVTHSLNLLMSFSFPTNCLLVPLCLSWRTGEWNDCDAPCGGGFQYRGVDCLYNDESGPRVVEDAYCAQYSQAPTDQQKCNMQACPDYGRAVRESCLLPTIQNCSFLQIVAQAVVARQTIVSIELVQKCLTLCIVGYSIPKTTTIMYHEVSVGCEAEIRFDQILILCWDLGYSIDVTESTSVRLSNIDLSFSMNTSGSDINNVMYCRLQDRTGLMIDFENCCVTYVCTQIISYIPAENAVQCRTTTYGCCYDRTTPAAGPNGEGCRDPPAPYERSICSLPKAAGSCASWTARFFFNVLTNKCTEFWYGGCHGNSNHFATEEECHRVCHEPNGAANGNGNNGNGNGNGDGDSNGNGNGNGHTNGNGNENAQVRIDQSDPSSVEALVGQTVVLPCRVSPPPSSFRGVGFLCFQNHIPIWLCLCPFFRQQQQPNGSLLLGPVSKSDAGWFLCVATREQERDHRYVYLTVSGKALAKVCALPSRQCVPHVITYVQRGRPSRSPPHRRRTNSHQGERKTPYILILKHRRRRKFTLERSAPSLLETRAGNAARLSCTVVPAAALPFVSIQWTRDGRTISDSRFVQQSDGALLIESLRTEDAGIYTCSASTQHQLEQRRVQLRMSDCPLLEKLVIQGTTVYGLHHHHHYHDGFSSGRRNGVPVRPDGRKVQVSPDGSLILNNVQAFDEGTYTCNAYAGVYSVSATADVRIAKDVGTPCLDQPKLANCELVVYARMCTNPYYAAFCCASCARQDWQQKIKYPQI